MFIIYYNMSSLLKNIELERKVKDAEGSEETAYARWKLDKDKLTYDIVDRNGELILYTQNPGVDKLLGMIKEDNFPYSCKQKGGFWGKT
jgi:hypothetical protein